MTATSFEHISAIDFQAALNLFKYPDVDIYNPATWTRTYRIQGTRVNLKAYQLVGLYHLFTGTRETSVKVLGDKMGLGKTIIAIIHAMIVAYCEQETTRFMKDPHKCTNAQDCKFMSSFPVRPFACIGNDAAFPQTVKYKIALRTFFTQRSVSMREVIGKPEVVKPKPDLIYQQRYKRLRRLHERYPPGSEVAPQGGCLRGPAIFFVKPAQILFWY